MLEKYFLPDTYAENVFAVDLKALKNEGIRLILCDIDNTLAAFDDVCPDERAKSFMKKVEQEGMQFLLISNNTKKRVRAFADRCNAGYYYSSTKPLKYQYKRILKEHHLSKSEVAVIGDQLLTDILGGKRMCFYTILTSPLTTSDIIYTKVTRIAERMIYFIFEKQGKLKRGEYYGKIL